jgi:hypothetical protein
MLLQPKHFKPDEKWDTTLNRGRGDWRLLKFKGFVASVPRLLKLIVWKAMKGIFNLFELPGVLEYQFRENQIAFSITCLLNCIGICNVLTVLRLWSISLKCNTIQKYIINELILKYVSGEVSMPSDWTWSICKGENTSIWLIIDLG